MVRVHKVFNMKSLLYVSSDVSSVQIELLKKLKSQGIDCHLLSYSISGHNAKSIDGIDSMTYSFKTIWKGPIFFIRRLYRVYKKSTLFLNNRKIDILHGNMCSGSGYICRKISKKNGIPYVLSIRNTDMNLWFLWKIPWIKKMIFKNVLSAKNLIFLSKAYMDDFVLRFPKKFATIIRDKCIIIPNGINDFWFNNIYENKRKLSSQIKMLTVGRIEDNKNQLLVAEAIERAMHILSVPFSYVIVGDCNNPKLLDKLKNYRFIEIKSFKEKEQLIDEFRDADIFIMASHFETFGLVYAEALTQGLPVIYTRGQGFDKQFDEGEVGFSVDSFSVDDIADGIIKVVGHYNSIVAKTTQLSAKYKWSNVVNDLDSLYSSVLYFKK